MWEIDIKLQFYYWLLSVVLGGIYCLFYDFFRAVRLAVKCSDIAVFFQDVLYFFVISLSTFCFLLATTNGQVRGFVIFGAVIGFILIRYTVSYIIMKIYCFILKYTMAFLKRVLYLKNLIFKRIDKTFYEFSQKSKKIFKKSANTLKKLLKKQ